MIIRDFRLLISSTVLMFFVAIPLVVFSADEIEYYASGQKKTLKGKIVRERLDRITIEVAGNNQDISIGDLISVEYDKRPPQMITAKSLYDQDRYEEAIEALTRVGQSIDPQEAPYALQQVAFYIFDSYVQLALMNPANEDRAIEKYNQFVENFPNSRHFYPMGLAVAQLHISKQEWDKAAAIYDKYASSGISGAKQIASTWKGVIQQMQGNYPEAQTLFQEVIDAAVNKESLNFAKIYLAKNQYLQDKAAEAKLTIEEVIDSVPVENKALKASAHNILGDILLKTEESPKSAIVNGYLWVILVYNKDAKEVSRALYQCSMSARTAGDLEYADRLKNQLLQEYPNTNWAKKMQENGNS